MFLFCDETWRTLFVAQTCMTVGYYVLRTTAGSGGTALYALRDSSCAVSYTHLFAGRTRQDVISIEHFFAKDKLYSAFLTPVRRNLRNRYKRFGDPHGSGKSWFSLKSARLCICGAFQPTHSRSAQPRACLCARPYLKRGAIARAATQ